MKPSQITRIAHITLGLLCLALLGCQTTPTTVLGTSEPIDWPERLIPNRLSLRDIEGSPIQLYGIRGHGHIAGWYRPQKGPLSMLSITTEGRSDMKPEQGAMKIGMQIESKMGMKGSASITVGDKQRTTAAFIRHPDTPKGIAIILTSLNVFSKPEAKLLESLATNQWLAVAITPSSDLVGMTRLPVLSDQSASHMGSLVDHHLAERAYATESVLQFLVEQEPSLAKLPKVIIGASLGALAAPATAVRLGEIDALVMIAGGADIPSIAVDSALQLMRLDPSIHAKEGRRVLKAAQAAMQLDPGKLAERLPDSPRLVIEGSLDHIIPALYRHRLYRALGKPERWRYPVGHLLLFGMVLPTKIDAIGEWLDEHATSRASTSL